MLIIQNTNTTTYFVKMFIIVQIKSVAGTLKTL